RRRDLPARPRRSRGPRVGPALLSRGARPREPHRETRADRSASLLGNRERLLGRDPASRAAVAGAAHEPPERGGDRAAVARDPQDARGMERAVDRRGEDVVSREGHGVPRGDGRAWPVRKAVSGLRHGDPEDRVRRERVELLPDLSDRRQAPGGSRALATSQRRLAEDARGARGAKTAMRRALLAAAVALGLPAAARGQPLEIPHEPELSLFAGYGHTFKTNRGNTDAWALE